MSTEICIVSGGTRLRLPSPVNHKVYAEIQGVDYRLECGPVGELKNRFYFKLKTLVRVLPRYAWALWIDDDAFFTDLTVDLHKICQARNKEVLLVLADGRVRSGGAWTTINSGVMLVRNLPESLESLDRCLNTEIEEVRKWWDPDLHGMFTNSDQDTLLYQMRQYPSQGTFEILPHLELNAREYHYSKQLSEHYICHFPGLPDKLEAVRRFGERFGVGATLIPTEVLQSHGCQGDVADELLLSPRRSPLSRVQGRLRRIASSLRRG